MHLLHHRINRMLKTLHQQVEVETQTRKCIYVQWGNFTICRPAFKSAPRHLMSVLHEMIHAPLHLRMKYYNSNSVLLRQLFDKVQII